MKLATRPDGSRDGELVIVSRDGTRAMPARDVATTMQDAIDRWDEVEGRLRERAEALERGDTLEAFDVDLGELRAPFPRAYQFIDGSAYLNHVELVRRARGAELPEQLKTDPLVYQGVSDPFLGPTDDIVAASEDWGIDFEAEIGVVTDDVPYRTPESKAADHVKLLLLINDVSLRKLIPSELGKNFGFLVSKPPCALSPLAITPDELGEDWHDARVWRPLEVHWNDDWFGAPWAGGEMHFSFGRLIEHCAQTRPLAAGTLIGSGTISNADRYVGSCCIAEQRFLEKVDTGEMKMPFMSFGDTVHIDMKGRDGGSLFGPIRQRVVRWEG